MTSYRIDRFDSAINHWSIVRYAIDDLHAAIEEMAAMREESPNIKLRLIKIEVTIILEDVSDA